MDNKILKINSNDLKELSGSMRVARYFTYDKLKDIIDNERLYFHNCELFDDDNERKRIERGRYKNQKARRISIKIHNALINECKAYVSCWTIFEDENAALWKIYDNTSTGACIVTTVEKLRKQLDQNILIGQVSYEENANILFIDIEGIASNYLSTEFVKISPYAFEKEVRAVFFSKETSNSIKMGINFESLVDEVYLSPFANSKNNLRTEKLLLKRIVKNKIKQSTISETKKTSKEMSK
ncbi:hypothetical protein SDC9_103813 [bioreactor metagenome]|uniref:DUF2971 domain-containing protein n=1 Tax=bioreactor metagenome TaxID=1076179 RepID=A0A645AW23_9ZZZZ